MSGLNELLQKYTLDGVEYKKVKDIASILRGKRLTKDQLSEDYKYPVFHGGLEPLGFYMENNREANTVMIINVGASAGTVGFCDTDFWSSDGCFCLSKSASINPKYLYHALAVNERFLMSKVRRAGIPTLDSKVIEELKIPVPSMEIQNEIVRILNNFKGLTAKLTAELTAELTNRKKQYECYRELVLDKNEKVEWVPLLDVADTFTGLTYKPSDVAPTGTIVLRSSNIQNRKLVFDDNVYVQMDNIPQRAIVQEDDVLICVRNGSKALIGKAAMIPKHNTPMAFGAFMTILRAKKQINPKYLFFVWQSPRIQNMIHGESGMPINQITKKMLEQILVPLPSLEEQLKVVEVLERFDDIYVEIADKLNAEIEARQKQYEYYRDKLLTFKEASE